MTKHVADRPHDPQKGGRLKTYAGIEREDAGPRAQTEALQKRPRGPRDGGARAREFVRIERGGKA